MAFRESKVIIVKFKENGKLVEPEYYFSTISGVFEQFTTDVIGAVPASVYNDFSNKGCFDGKKAKIWSDVIKHKIR